MNPSDKDKKQTSSSIIGGDYIGQDKVGNDKVGKDKIEGNKIVNFNDIRTIRVAFASITIIVLFVLYIFWQQTISPSNTIAQDTQNEQPDANHHKKLDSNSLANSSQKSTNTQPSKPPDSADLPQPNQPTQTFRLTAQLSPKVADSLTIRTSIRGTTYNAVINQQGKAVLTFQAKKGETISIKYIKGQREKVKTITVNNSGTLPFPKYW
jgi:cytoskeletal protein RodZ